MSPVHDVDSSHAVDCESGVSAEILTMHFKGGTPHLNYILEICSIKVTDRGFWQLQVWIEA